MVVQDRADNPAYLQAFDYLDAGKIDSSFIYFNLGKEAFLAQRDSFGVAKCLVNMAIILTDEGDYFGGQETSLEALTYLNRNNVDHHRYLESNYNNLGLATYQLRDIDKAIGFYQLAIKYAQDSSTMRLALNNMARAYHDGKDYDKALQIYEGILKNTEKNTVAYARVLTNYSNTRWRIDPAYNAAPDLHAALRIRQAQNDQWGVNSSYAHLTEYYAAKQSDSALMYARKRLAVSRRIRSAHDQINALLAIIRLGHTDSTKFFFERYRQLSDSVRLARAAAKNQFALIRYEVEKNKADNLRLQKENAETAYQIVRQRIWTGLALTVAVFIIGGGMFWHKKRTQRLALDAQHRIDAHKLKTSKKIHDVVANGIYRVMAEIENQDKIDRDGILDRLENMYEKSRDISYETNGSAEVPQTYHERIAQLLKSFATASTKVIIVGNASDLWAGVDAPVKEEIECILQELMVNMRKHSEATDVVVRFEKEADELRISYHDNGVGLPDSFVKGNGLSSTGSRIAGLNGQINFVSEGGNGLKIVMKFPVA